MTLIKSISGIRGTIGGPQGDNLTPIDIVKFTTAYVRFMSEKHSGKRLTIVVGRDARISGTMVNDIIEGTLLGCGADVINVGLCTTPGTEMAVITHKADGGIIITASLYRSLWTSVMSCCQKSWMSWWRNWPRMSMRCGPRAAWNRDGRMAWSVAMP